MHLLLFFSLLILPLASTAQLGDFAKHEWSYDTDGYLTMFPLLEDGVLYIGTEKGELYAFNQNDGSIKWKLELPNGGMLIHQIIAVDGMLIFDTARPSKLYGVDQKTGEIKWQQDQSFDDDLLAKPFVYQNNVIINCLRGIVCFDPKTGTIKWQSAPYPERKAPTTAVVIEDQLVFGLDTLIFGLDPNTGKELWKHSNDWKFQQVALEVNGNVVLGNRYQLACFNLKGEKLWEKEGVGTINSTDGKDLYSTTRKGIVKLDGESGEEIWTYNGGKETWYSTYHFSHYLDGKLYGLMSKQHVYVLDAKSGEALTEVSGMDKSYMTPIASGNQIICGRAGKVTCLSMEAIKPVKAMKTGEYTIQYASGPFGEFKQRSSRMRIEVGKKGTLYMRTYDTENDCTLSEMAFKTAVEANVVQLTSTASKRRPSCEDDFADFQQDMVGQSNPMGKILYVDEEGAYILADGNRGGLLRLVPHQQ